MSKRTDAEHVANHYPSAQDFERPTDQEWDALTPAERDALDPGSVEGQRPVYVVKDVHGCFAIEPQHHGLTLVVWSEHEEDAKTFNTREEAQAHVEQLKQLGFTNVAGVRPV